MSFTFAHPLLLIALLPLGIAAALIRCRFAPPASRRQHLWATLHWGATVLLVLALAQPQVGALSPETVLLVDRSASVNAHEQAIEEVWIRSVRGADCPTPCRIVQFAAGSQPLPATSAALAAHTPGPGQVEATDIGAAVDTALGLLPHGGRAIVLSDGWETTGDSLAAAARARSAHVQLDYVRLSDPSLRDAAVTLIHAPSAVHVSDPLPLQITVRTTVAGPATLYVTRDGKTIGSQVVNLRVGDNPLLLSYTAPGTGWHSFAARIAMPADHLAADNTLATTVDVVPAPRVLVVAQASSPSLSVLDSILRREGIAVASVTPGGLPGTGRSLGGFDAVVLDDVPAAVLGRVQLTALSQAVTTGGLGLLVLGGPHSFSLGGYANTRLEQLLPVSSLVPGNLQRRNVAIELVVDRSGSMIDLAGGVPKIQMVRVAGTQTAQFIAAHHDQLGVVDFDFGPHVLVPIQRLDGANAERNAIAKIQGLQANGGTNIYAGLLEGTQQLLKSNAPDKHMILVTDGISEPGNYAPLVATLHHDRVQVATVALGSDADKSFLRSIASATRGQFYYTNDAHALPRIFDRETRFAVQPVRVAGHVTVTVAADSPVIRSLAGARLPTLSGNVVTRLKPGAQADLLAQGSSSQDSPALAQWEVGAGRVVAFTPGIGGPFGASWSDEVELWNDALRWVQRGVTLPLLAPSAVAGAPPSLDLDLARAGTDAFGISRITGTLTSTAGIVYPVDFVRVGPSLYRAALPTVPAGVYGFDIPTRDSGGLTASGLLAIPYSLEYLPRPAVATALAPLSARTGGRQLGAGQPEALRTRGELSLWWPLALAALVLFLAGALGRQLEPSPTEDGTRGSHDPGDDGASPHLGRGAPRGQADPSRAHG